MQNTKWQFKEPEIDVKKIQQQMQDTFSLPKLELHTHISGCLRPQTFTELVLEKGLDLDKVDFYKVDTATAFEFFKLVSQCVTDLKTL